jgi:hypothetical protein
MALATWTGCTGSGGVLPNGNDNGQPSVTGFQFSPNLRAVAIVDEDGFSELLDLSRREPPSTLQPIVENYILDVAEQFASAADFLVFTIDTHREKLRFNSVGGFNVTIDSPEFGLGPFVAGQDFENFPNLRSYIYLARKDSLVLGPSLHEIAHAWGVRLQNPPTLGAQASQSDNHWGFSSVGGQMGGWMPRTLIDLGDGQYELRSGNIEPDGRSFNTLPYADLELYLMGLAAPEEVAPIQVAINPTFQSLFQFTADDVVEIAIESIIQGNGTRVPNVDDAQKNFGISLIVLTDHELSISEWRFYQDSMDFLAFNGDREIADAFPEFRYSGQPIRELIATPDPEDDSRSFINYHEATQGRGDIAFVPLSVAAE